MHTRGEANSKRGARLLGTTDIEEEADIGCRAFIMQCQATYLCERHHMELGMLLQEYRRRMGRRVKRCLDSDDTPLCAPVVRQLECDLAATQAGKEIDQAGTIGQFDRQVLQ